MAKKGLFARIKKFFKDVRNELRKVNWPTRKELTVYTGVVLVTVFIVATFVGVVDLLFSRIISFFILR